MSVRDRRRMVRVELAEEELVEFALCPSSGNRALHPTAAAPFHHGLRLGQWRIARSLL